MKSRWKWVLAILFAGVVFCIPGFLAGYYYHRHKHENELFGTYFYLQATINAFDDYCMLQQLNEGDVDYVRMMLNMKLNSAALMTKNYLENAPEGVNRKAPENFLWQLKQLREKYPYNSENEADFREELKAAYALGVDHSAKPPKETQNKPVNTDQ